MSKVLIIEDDTVLCRVLRNWLERKRMQVECVSSVAQARKAIAGTDADIILSDMRLPDGDGIGLLEWMNENRYRIPFIIMTQHAEVLSAVRAMTGCAALSGLGGLPPTPFLLLFILYVDLVVARHKPPRGCQPQVPFVAARLRRDSPAPCKGKVFGSNPKSIELLDTHLAMFRRT